MLLAVMRSENQKELIREGKAVPVHAVQGGIWGAGVITPPISNLGTGRKRAVSLTPHYTYLWRKRRQYPMSRRLRRPQKGYEHRLEKTRYRALSKMERVLLSCPALAYAIHRLERVGERKPQKVVIQGNTGKGIK
jgi:hypothetical protein